MRLDDKSRIPVSSFEKVPGALKKSKVSELAKNVRYTFLDLLKHAFLKRQKLP